MNISITPEKIKNIVQEVEMGMLCYFHIKTGELECVPDELKGHAGYEEEFWKDSLKKIKTHRRHYICFEGMESSESFRMMQKFIQDIKDDITCRRFQEIITFKKPFGHFKQLLNDYPLLKEEWYSFKDEQYRLFIQQQLETYNAVHP
jgi:Uncharacterised protein family (UPF0158)